MNTRLTLSVLVLAGMAIAACGSDEGGTDSSDAVEAVPELDPSAEAPTSDDLSSRAFVSTEVTGYELVEGTTINILFEGTALAANAQCNTLSGGYTLDGNVLTAGPFAMTAMACDDALMEQDTWLNDFLSGLPRLAFDGETLTMVGTSGTIVLEEAHNATLLGTEWVLTGTVANEAVTSVPDDSTASITMTETSVDVDTGCNTGSGTFEEGEGTLTFGPIALTRMACPPEVMDVESAMVSVLDGEVSYILLGNVLTLEGSDGTGLEFTAAEAE